MDLCFYVIYYILHNIVIYNMNSQGNIIGKCLALKCGGPKIDVNIKKDLVHFIMH